MNKYFLYLPILLLAVCLIPLSCEKEPFVDEADLLEEVTERGRNHEFVVSPTGVDDTENLQAAFDAAVPYGHRAKVILEAGTYYVNPIFVENFRGEFVGAGMNATVVDLIPGHDFGEISFDNTPSPDAPWPTVFTFVGGDVTIKDIKFTATDPTPVSFSWFGLEFGGLSSYILIAGETVNSKLERVTIEGLQVSDEDGGIHGSNINYAFLVFGDFSAQWEVSGTHEVYSSLFKNVGLGTKFGIIGNANITVGGSPAKGNTYNHVYASCQFADVSNVNADFSFNTITDAFWTGVMLNQGFYYPGFVPEMPPEPSHVQLRNNYMELTEGGWGIEVYDNKWRDFEVQGFDVSCVNNTIDLSDPIPQIGAYLANVKDGMFVSNTITGAGEYYGTFLAGATNGTDIVANNYNALEVMYSHIFLGSNTYENRVVCGRSEPSIIDLGRDNDILCSGLERGSGGDEAVIQDRINQHQGFGFPF